MQQWLRRGLKEHIEMIKNYSYIMKNIPGVNIFEPV